MADPSPGTHEPPPARAANEPGPGQAARRPWRRRRALLLLGGLVALVAVGVLAYVLLHAGQESTDDAQVDADVVGLAPRVAGQVTAAPVAEDQAVRAGQLVLQLEDRDYRARVERAAAELASARGQADAADAQVAVAEAAAHGSLEQARAGLAGSGRSVAAARKQVDQARAEAASREATLRLAEAEAQRARTLRAAQAVTQQALDQAETQDAAAQAGARAGRASVGAAEEGLRRAEAQVAESQGRVVTSGPVEARIAAARAAAVYQRARAQAAEAALALARLELEWTRLVAPADGVVSGITGHVGSLAAVGQVLAQFVPARKYVTANFKETQVGRMRVGQRAEVDVDTYGRTLRGHVESLSGGTGARFSLLPPENATGNYVKVAQRIPVRVALEDVPPGMVLRAGQSVEVTVHVK